MLIIKNGDLGFGVKMIRGDTFQLPTFSALWTLTHRVFHVHVVYNLMKIIESKYGRSNV